jgi:hypothetical protein
VSAGEDGLTLYGGIRLFRRRVWERGLIRELLAQGCCVGLERSRSVRSGAWEHRLTFQPLAQGCCVGLERHPHLRSIAMEFAEGTFNRGELVVKAPRIDVSHRLLMLGRDKEATIGDHTMEASYPCTSLRGTDTRRHQPASWLERSSTG